MTERTHLTAEELEIRERVEKAPAAPWCTDTLYHRSSTEVCLALLDANGRRLSDTLNADDQTVNEEVDEDSSSFYVSGPCADALEFAAHARTDIPKLLDSLEAARRELAEAKAVALREAAIWIDEHVINERRFSPRTFSTILRERADELLPSPPAAQEKSE